MKTIARTIERKLIGLIRNVTNIPLKEHVTNEELYYNLPFSQYIDAWTL